MKNPIFGSVAIRPELSPDSIVSATESISLKTTKEFVSLNVGA